MIIENLMAGVVMNKFLVVVTIVLVIAGCSLPDKSKPVQTEVEPSKEPVAQADKEADVVEKACSPLCAAVNAGDADRISALITSGADPCEECPICFRPVIVHSVYRGDLKAVRIFIEAGVDVNTWGMFN